MTAHPVIYLNSLDRGYGPNVVAGLEHVGFFRSVPAGARVFVKPNLTFPEYRPGVMTSMECIEAVLECLAQRGYQVIVGEADSGGYNKFSMDAVFEATGLNRLASRFGVRLVNISRIEPEVVSIRAGWRTLHVPFPKLLLREIDAFITLPVPKIHMNSGVSMSIKNQWGCIQDPAERLKLHPFLAQVLFEFNCRLPRAYSIIDGRFGLTRSGPMRGDPVPLNWLLAANDLVAADRLCCRLMQVDESTIGFLQHFKRAGWWTSFEQIAVNCDWRSFVRERFYLEREWTDLPGYFCFHSAFLAWLGYRSPLAGFAHWLLYLFREPFYEYGKEKEKFGGPSDKARPGQEH